MRLIQEYCVNNRLLSDSRKSRRIKLNQISDGEQYEKLEQLLSELEDGILYLEDISACNARVQERLAEYIANGAKKKGRSVKKENVRLVMSADEKMFSQISRKLLVNVPVICEIPSWIERNEDERKAFVVKFFKEEQEQLGRTLYLSEKLIHKLMNYQLNIILPNLSSVLLWSAQMHTRRIHQKNRWKSIFTICRQSCKEA